MKGEFTLENQPDQFTIKIYQNWQYTGNELW